MAIFGRFQKKNCISPDSQTTELCEVRGVSRKHKVGFIGVWVARSNFCHVYSEPNLHWLCYMSLILDINQSQLKTVERKKEERNSNFYLDKNPSGPIIRSCNVALLFKLVEKKLRLSCLNHGHRMPGYPKLRTATFFLIGEFSATLTVTTSV